MRLAWAEDLSQEELEDMIGAYIEMLETQALMRREALRRSKVNGSAEAKAVPARSSRERLIWQRIAEDQAAFYEAEAKWAKKLRRVLEDLK